MLLPVILLSFLSFLYREKKIQLIVILAIAARSGDSPFLFTTSLCKRSSLMQHRHQQLAIDFARAIHNEDMEVCI